MIDISKANISFKKFIDNYSDENKLSTELKIVHTYHVVENAKKIAEGLNLSKDDIALAELIAILHDIGRFEELKFLNQFDSVKFDHASYGVKMLFEDNLIRQFIEDSSYDKIIKNAINNHSRLSIEEGLDEGSILHSKIIRDADKLDNLRVKKEEKLEAMFPGKVKGKEDLENSIISDKVYNAIKNQKCVDIHDRESAIDYWLCVLAFVFDLNFKMSKKLVKENDYINALIDRFQYNNIDTKVKMEEIRNILNNFLDDAIFK